MTKMFDENIKEKEKILEAHVDAEVDGLLFSDTKIPLHPMNLLSWQSSEWKTNTKRPFPWIGELWCYLSLMILML